MDNIFFATWSAASLINIIVLLVMWETKSFKKAVSNFTILDHVLAHIVFICAGPIIWIAYPFVEKEQK